MPLDKETSEVLNKGLRTRDFVKSEDWSAIKLELTDKLVALADITTLADADPTALLREIGVRKLAINLVMGWVREIEGKASQYEANAETFRKTKEEAVIVQF